MGYDNYGAPYYAAPYHGYGAPAFGYFGAFGGGVHVRYPYYGYRHPWFYQGPPSHNVTITG